MTSIHESEVMALLDHWSAAIRAKDIDRLMALYSPDIVYFDVVPPLRYTGLAAVRSNFLRWFGTWRSSIGVELRDLHLSASDGFAAAHMLHRTSGTLMDGREVDYWVRASVSCERSNQTWLIAHEHISVPIDPQTRSAIMDLVP